MGKPIKDRGIRWQESYGDKSTYLKEEMEKQVGPGSYFRWEGHDFTTGTDYYVVVSPGYSQKLGYYFFAGLRKMPADQGASGKKFKNQSEALSYAMDTWGVTRPNTKPAKPYIVNDIVNKPIVLEPQHEKKSSSSDNVIVTSGKITEAMSMQGSGHVTSNFVPKAAKKTYPEELCWAYKLSPTMGFLSALYTRKRFMGTDIVNMPASGAASKAYNEFTGTMGKAPLAPIYATCERPTPDSFASSTSRVDVDNQLVKVQRGDDGKVLGFNVNKPLREQEDDSYNLVRWGDVTIKPTITIQPQVMHGTDMASLWAQLSAIKGVALPREATIPPTGKRRNSPVSMRFEVTPEAYEQLVSTVSKHIESKGLKMVPPVIGNQSQKDLVDIIAHHRENNVPIDWNTPYYEVMRMSGSQLMVYDKMGVPMGMKLASSSQANEAKIQSEEHGDEGHSYVLSDPQALLADTIFPGYQGPQDDGMTSPIVQFIGDNLDKFHTHKDEAARDAAVGVIKKLTELSGTQDRNGLMALAQQVSPYIRTPMTRKAFSTAMASLEDGRLAHNKAFEMGGDKAGMEQAQNQIRAAHDTIRPMLTAFRALASHNLLHITNEHVMDSRTCSPVMYNVKSQSYDVDASLLPTPGGKLSPDGVAPVVWRDHVPPFAVRAKKEGGANGQVYAGRRYDPASGRYVYGPLPNDFEPYQQMSGMRVTVEDPAMYFPRDDGSMYEIPKSVWTRYDPNSRGRAIPGEAYDIGMGPPSESAAKQGRHLLDARMSQDAFRAVMQKHRVKEVNGTIRDVRRYRSAPLFNSDPETNKDAYRYKTSSGREIDLSNNAEKRGQYVYFHDSADLMRMMMTRMGMTEQEFGPFTPVSSEDLRIAYDVMIDGVHYYRAINNYDQLANSDKGRQYMAMRDASQVPAGERQAFTLFKEGQQFRASFDQNKYNYGKVCEACGKGDKIPPEVTAEMQRSLANPEQSLSPKPGTLWVIEHSNDGASWEKLKSEGPDGTFPVLFGSKMMAELNAGLRDKTVMNLDVKNLVEQGLQVRVVPVQSPSMTPHTSADDKYKTRQAQSLIHKVGQYKMGKTRDELDQQKEDRFSAGYASPGDDQGVAPSSPEATPVQQEQEPEPLAQEPVPEPATEPVPEQVVQQPSPQPPEMPQAPVQQAPVSQAPSMDVNRLIRQWQSQGKSVDDMRARAKAHQGKPYFGELMSAIDRSSGRAAKSIERLVSLANKLDSIGRHEAADAVDRVVRVAMERQNA